MPGTSLRLSKDLLMAIRENARELQISRAEYIRRAIEKMNRETQATLRAKRLSEASREVRKESMRVNAELDTFETDVDTEQRGVLAGKSRLRHCTELGKTALHRFVSKGPVID